MILLIIIILPTPAFTRLYVLILTRYLVLEFYMIHILFTQHVAALLSSRTLNARIAALTAYAFMASA